MPSPAHRARRFAALLLLAALAAFAAPIGPGGAPAASAQAPLPAFRCDGTGYIVTGPGSSLRLKSVNTRTAALANVGSAIIPPNGIGFNPQDNYIYGVDKDTFAVHRVGSNGESRSIGVIQGRPTNWEGIVVGTFLPNGQYLVMANLTNGGARFHRINVATSPPQVIWSGPTIPLGSGAFADIAYNPVDGEVYGYHNQVTSNGIGGADRLAVIDYQATNLANLITFVGPTQNNLAQSGASFFDSAGRLWLYGSRTGPEAQNRLYRLDNPTGAPGGGSRQAEIVAQGQTVQNSDGASCPFTVNFTKTAPRSVCAGDTFTYTFRLSQRSLTNTIVTGTLTDILDDGRTFVAGSLVNPHGGTANAYAGTDTLTLTGVRVRSAANNPAPITIDVAVPLATPPGTLINQAALTNVAGGGALGASYLSEYPNTVAAPDPTPIIVRDCLTEVDVAIDKTSPGTPVGPGDTIDYQLVVTNNGPDNATGVVLTDTIPAGTTFVSASDSGAYSAATGVITWPFFDLANGATRTFTVTVAVPDDADLAEGDTLINTATVDHPDDTDPTNNTDDAEDPVDPPPYDLAIDKTSAGEVVFPGDTIDYQLVVTNNGPGVARGATVTDTIPDGTTFVSADSNGRYNASTRTVTWPDFDLANGGTARFAVTVEIPDGNRFQDGDIVVNTATVDAPDDTDPTNNTDDAEDPIGGTDVSVDKDDGRTEIDPGGRTTYTITVTNEGDGPATDIALTDTIPDRTAFVSAGDDGDYNASTRTVTWPDFDLEAGEDRAFTVTVRVNADVGEDTGITNVACAETPGDTNPDNDCDDDTNRTPGGPPLGGPPLAFTGGTTRILLAIAFGLAAAAAVLLAHNRRPRRRAV